VERFPRRPEGRQGGEISTAIEESHPRSLEPEWNAEVFADVRTAAAERAVDAVAKEGARQAKTVRRAGRLAKRDKTVAIQVLAEAAPLPKGLPPSPPKPSRRVETPADTADNAVKAMVQQAKQDEAKAKKAEAKAAAAQRDRRISDGAKRSLAERAKEARAQAERSKQEASRADTLALAAKVEPLPWTDKDGVFEAATTDGVYHVRPFEASDGSTLYAAEFRCAGVQYDEYSVPGPEIVWNIRSVEEAKAHAELDSARRKTVEKESGE
jgi:hypothetical protein